MTNFALTAIGSNPNWSIELFQVRKPSSRLAVGRWFYPGTRSCMAEILLRGASGLPQPIQMGVSPYCAILTPHKQTYIILIA